MTAVEWYNSKVIELMTQREQGNIDVLEFRNQLDLLFEQAKQREELQHNETWDTALDKYEVRVGHTTDYEDFYDYYNETFK